MLRNLRAIAAEASQYAMKFLVPGQSEIDLGGTKDRMDDGIRVGAGFCLRWSTRLGYCVIRSIDSIYG